MAINKATWWVSILLIIGVTLGCAPTEQKLPPAKVERDLGRLSKLIEMPVPASQVWWQTVEPPPSRVPGPSDWQLIAVLQMDPDFVKRIVAKSKVISGQTYNFDSDKKIKNFLAPHGQPSSKGYDAGPFEKSPLLDGFFLTIGKDKIFVYLSTK